MVPLKTSQSPNCMVVRDAPSLSAIVPASMHSAHPLQKHRQKNKVHANKRCPKMHFPPELAHLSASCFREPIIDASEESENCARRNDVMKVRDDVIGVVQVKIG